MHPLLIGILIGFGVLMIVVSMSRKTFYTLCVECGKYPVTDNRLLLCNHCMKGLKRYES
jgi:hypothetical protein